MPFYKVMTTGGAYTQGEILNIEDQELFAIVSRDVFLQPIDPTAVSIENALYGATGIVTFPTAAAAANGVSIAEVLRYVSETQLSKLDDAATLGLLGTNNSLAYRVHEIERHVHCYEKWFGVAAIPSGTHKADRVGQGIAAFELDGGNLTWGSWVQILGSGDTTEKYDPHKIFVTDVQETTPYFVQLAFGATGDGAVTAGTFTEFVFRVNATNSDRTEIPVNCRRQSAATLGWARCMSLGANTATMSFYFGLHTYEG